VAEILRPLPIEALATPVPSLLGLTTLRGQPVPVIDPARLLGEEGILAPARFIVLRVAGRTAILAVDEIVGVRDLPEGALAGLPPLLEEQGAVISRIGQLDHDLLLVLRTARFVQDDLRPAEPEGAWR
jgi:purine-binding chemotaxis protein CheW